MGLDAMAVVDPRLRVYGVDGLRINDASIMPSVVSGNLQASLFMIAEKGADMVLEDAGTISTEMPSSAAVSAPRTKAS